MPANPKKIVILDAVSDSKSRSESTGIIFFSLVVILVLILGAIRPTLITVFEILSSIEEKKEVSNQLDRKIESMQNLREEYEVEYKSSFKDFTLIYPVRSDFSLLLANIEKIVERNNMELVSIKFEKPRSNFSVSSEVPSLEVIEPWSAQIAVKGSSTRLISLLQDFEEQPYLPSVESVSFSDKVDDEGKKNFSITLLSLIHI